MKSTDLPKSAPKPPIWHSPPTRTDGDIREWICANGRVEVVCIDDGSFTLYRYSANACESVRYGLTDVDVAVVTEFEIGHAGGLAPPPEELRDVEVATVKESPHDELLTVDVCEVLRHYDTKLAQELLRRADTRTLLTVMRLYLSGTLGLERECQILAKALGISEDQ